MKTVIALIALAGCSTLDEGVATTVVGTTIAVTPSSPDALATVNIDLELDALSRADHQVALDHVVIERPGATTETDVGIAPFTPFEIHANETKDLTLSNGSTTNAELAIACNQTVKLFVYLTFLDTVNGDEHEGTFGGTTTAITCPI